MAEPSLLDFNALLAPIPGDDPAGQRVPFAVQQQLEELRKEEHPEAYAEDDPMRPTTFKKADWGGIVELARKTLIENSKDLLVAARLTEALTRLRGFQGLHDGLHLLRELVDQCWDRLRPPVEDGDVEVRAGPFYWLDDPDKGARFPTTVRLLPLVVGESGNYGWLHWRQSQEGRGQVSHEEFEQAAQATPPDDIARVTGEIARCREELDGLVRGLGVRMGAQAPGLTSLRQALEECHGLAAQIVRRKRPVFPGETDTSNEGAVPAAEGPAPAGRPASREEVYRQLARAAEVLQGLEPHSPIPYLIKRAVELGALPFPQLIQALIRDPNVLAELNRELGLGEGPRQEPAGE
jgi:type VI secretion system protein ImpA